MNFSKYLADAIGQMADLKGQKPATNSRTGSPQSVQKQAADQALLRITTYYFLSLLLDYFKVQISFYY